MNRRDGAIVGSLLVALAIVAFAISLPAYLPPAPSPSARPTVAGPRPYVEGVIGRAGSVDPLTARSQPDRDLVALVFSGLVRVGPDGTIAADLASRWSSDADGLTWTFEIRPDAVWQDGVPLTARDVVFTVETLQDPAYSGPAAASWRDVTARAVDDQTVEFVLSNPLGGFLQAASQPIVPAHLLRGIPVTDLADSPFSRQPVGSGPFQLVRLDPDRAVLQPAVRRSPGVEPSGAGQAPPTDSLTTPGPTRRNDFPQPYLAGIVIRFFDDPESLLEAYQAGELDAASGLQPADADTLGRRVDSRLLHYPGTTLSAVLLNLRPSHPEFRTADARLGLLAAIDRDAIAGGIFAASAIRADGPIPPASWAYDPTASVPIQHNEQAAVAILARAGWTREDDGWHAPNDADPTTIDLLAPDAFANPPAAAMADAVAADWRSIGLLVEVVQLPASDYAARLRSGDFGAAIAEINLGFDPDLYPLLASSQVTSRGTNVIGLQDPALDKLLGAARLPGDEVDRKAAYRALQARISEAHYLLPLVFPDETVVFRSTVSGPVPRQVSDPGDRFWDVLTWRLADGR